MHPSGTYIQNYPKFQIFDFFQKSQNEVKYVNILLIMHSSGTCKENLEFYNFLSFKVKLRDGAISRHVEH